MGDVLEHELWELEREELEEDGQELPVEQGRVREPCELGQEELEEAVQELLVEQTAELEEANERCN